MFTDSALPRSASANERVLLEKDPSKLYVFETNNYLNTFVPKIYYFDLFCKNGIPVLEQNTFLPVGSCGCILATGHTLTLLFS